MNIAVVGGGTRCKRLMEVIERHKFQEMEPKIVAVSDVNDRAPGFRKAREQGLYVTADYNDFFNLEDIELIIELTGNIDIYNDIIAKKGRSVRAIGDKSVRLFWEISRISYMQKKAAQELEEARALYNALINELIQEEVMVIAYDHRILDVNDTLLAKLGLQRDEVLGRTCHEITHHQDTPCSGELHPCPLIQTLKTKKPSQTTHEHLDKDGRKIFYSISTYPLKEAGDVIGAIEVARDISKDINLQKVMMQQEKLVSIGRLSAGVAHEINNPLTTILTTAILIQEDLDPADPNYRELETIAAETLRCRKIVTSLLNFARQSRPDKRPNDPNKLVTESIVLTQKQAAFKDVAVKQELMENIPPVLADKVQIQQAIINLVLNAVEATEPGGTITITTCALPDKQQAEIIVSDTGEGISQEQMDKVFDPFFTTKDNGTGLGLAISHGIIEQHGGTIDVHSSPGEGTTFTLRLPFDTGRPDER